MWQLLLNLLGQTSNVVDLQTGLAMDRARKLGLTTENGANGTVNLDIQMFLYLHCQEMSLATLVYEKLEHNEVGMMRFHIGWHMRVHNFCLVAIHNAKKRGLNPLKSRKWRKKARLYLSMVQTWVEDGKAINLGHKLKLLQAEMLTLARPYPSDELLMEAFDEAIVRSARSGFRQDAALAAAFASKAVQNKLDKMKYAQRCQEL